MRSLTATLTNAQQARSIPVLVKIVLTEGANSYTYTKTRILDIDHKEEQFDQKAEVILYDNDGVIGALNLKGYKGVISYGVKGAAGEEYSACAPLYVINQREDSAPGRVTSTLSLIGIPNLLAEDHASENYTPDDTDTKTVKDIINDMFDGTMTCYSHCTTYTVTWDSEDSLIDSFQPKDSFRIYTNGTRLAALRRLLDYTKCCMRVEDDGEIHIFQPTTSGDSYDYEYSLTSGHAFWSKAYRSALVMPNYVVVKSQDDDSPSYSGYSEDTDSSDLIEARYYKTLRLASNAQAGDIAEAILSKFQLWAKLGAADVPINCGSEVLDYVKVTDERATNNRIGNIGSITRRYTRGKRGKRTVWSMTFSFGDWVAYDQARALLRDIETYTDEGSYFNRLWVKDLYAENILADNVDLYLSDISDDATYKKVLATHTDAGGIKISSLTTFDSNYDPTDKFDKNNDDLDDIPDGSTYKLLLATDVSAGHINLTSLATFATGYNPVEKAKVFMQDGVPTSISVGDIWVDTNDGNKMYRAASAGADEVKAGEWVEVPPSLDNVADGTTYARLKTTNLSSGNIKLTSAVAVDGRWYNTGGVEIDADTGIVINRATGTEVLQFLTGSTYGGIYIQDDASSYYLYLVAANGIKLPFGHIYPTNDSNNQNIGSLTDYWQYVIGKYLDFHDLTANNVTGSYGHVDFENAEYMDLPLRTSNPTKYEGRMFVDSSSHDAFICLNDTWEQISFV